MTSLITRCPKCATAFNVTEAHLNTANGAVRCGSCLNVFNGRENLTQTLKKQSAVALLDDDDLLISDDLELDEHAPKDHDSNPPSERVKDILDKAGAGNSEPVDDDESWALKLLEDEGHDPAHLGLHQEKAPEKASTQIQTAKAPSVTAAVAKPVVQPKPVEPKVPTIPKNKKLTESSADKEVLKTAAKPLTSKHVRPDDKNTQDDITPRSKLLDEDKAEETQAEAPQETETPTKLDERISATAASIKAEEYVSAKNAEPEPIAEIAEGDLAALQNEIDKAKVELTADQKPEEPQAPRLLVDAIEVEAVELQYSAKRPRWFSRMVWLTLAGLATLALAGQVAWLKFDQLSLKEPYRQYYGKACELIGCELPTRKSVSEIKTSNLLVRTHPNREGALLADVVIQNYAEFEQPFPKLALIFSNIKNKVVASRSFEPNEYLGGDLTGATMMPSLQAIHISLELVDPGKGAVSYKIVIEE